MYQLGLHCKWYFSTLFLMPSMGLSSWHDFLTGITIVNKGVRKVLAFYVIDDVVAALVLEDFSLLCTQGTSEPLS